MFRTAAVFSREHSGRGPFGGVGRHDAGLEAPSLAAENETVEEGVDLGEVFAHRPPGHRMVGAGLGDEPVRHAALREVAGDGGRAEQHAAAGNRNGVVGHIPVGVAVEEQQRRGRRRPPQFARRIVHGSGISDYPGIPELFREVTYKDGISVAEGVFGHQDRHGPGTRTAREDPLRVHAPLRGTAADERRGVAEVLGGHRKRRSEHSGEAFAVDRAGIQRPLHPQPVVDRHDVAPPRGEVAEIGKEPAVVARTSQETAPEEENHAGTRPCGGRKGRIAVQSQRVAVPDGVNEGLPVGTVLRTSGRLRARRSESGQRGEKQQHASHPPISS